MDTFVDKELVLVASTAQRPHDGYRNLMGRFDAAKALSNRIMLHNLRKKFDIVHYYTSVHAFVNNISLHYNHTVFPYYYSVGSRINYSYVQSICEPLGIRFVGPDVFSLTVCNDKVLSKDICRSQGILTPNCVVLYSAEDGAPTDALSPPVIVKPVYEGNSIGISKDSVCSDIGVAINKARALSAAIRSPVMIEEFIYGQEINISLIQGVDGQPMINSVSLKKRGDVFDYYDKHIYFDRKRYEKYNSPAIERHTEAFIKMFKMLGKVEFMRIDCIESNGELYCIELTPDADLSVSSALYKSVSDQYRYDDFLSLLVYNSHKYYENP